MQSLIAENDYETAKLEVERILTLIAEPDFAVSPEEKSHFLKMQDKLRQITNTVILQETN
jgi:hypothetical protein